MGRNGKNRWKISFHRSSSSSPSPFQNPPTEFLCPISRSLMADPVVVTTGQTFERNCVHFCKTLHFNPTLQDGTVPDFSTMIPNIAIKTTILSWCDKACVDRPKPIGPGSAEQLVRALMAENGAARKKLTHAESELTRGRTREFYSSSDESVSTATPLPLATRPSCYSSSTSSSEIVVEAINDGDSVEHDEIVSRLKSTQVYEQEEAVILLRKVSKNREESRVFLCTPLLLLALRSLLLSRYSRVQVNAVAALVNLSLEKINKVKIVRSGIVPHLINVLKGGSPESQEHAAGAIFSLALDDDNKAAIGVLGALPPLLHLLRAESERTRHDSAMALYHLSLVRTNRSKLVRLGSVQVLLGLVGPGGLAGRVMLVLCNLAACEDGRVAMLDAGAVSRLVEVLRRGELDSVATHESCVAVLYGLSGGGLRFRGLAKEAGAVEVLIKVEREGSDRARSKAGRVLQVLRGRSKEERVADLDSEEVVGSRVSRVRCRGNESCVNSS